MTSSTDKPGLLVLMEAEPTTDPDEDPRPKAPTVSRVVLVEKDDVEHTIRPDLTHTRRGVEINTLGVVSHTFQAIPPTDQQGVFIEGDPTSLAKSEGPWHALPEFPENPALRLAMLAHVSLRHRPVTEIEALVRWALQRDGQDNPSTESVDYFVGVLARHMGEVSRALGDGPSTAEEANATEDGLPSLTARFVTYLTNLGSRGREMAKELRRKHKPDAPWTVWLHREGGDRPGTGVMRSLAIAVWSDDVQPRWSGSRPLQSVGVQHGGDDYSPMPKLASPMSWAFGGLGVDAPPTGHDDLGQEGVSIDGDRYAHEPDFIRDAAEVRSLAGAKLPRSYRLLPDGHETRPHQTSLPLRDEGDSLPMTVAGSNGYVLSPHAAKIALLLLASSHLKRVGLGTLSLRQLTERINAGTKRFQARDDVATAKGLDELHRMFLYLPNNKKIQVFEVESFRDAEKARGDDVLQLGLTRLFCEELRRADSSTGLQGPSLSGREYRGEFLVNLTGIMRLPNLRPALMRYYMRCAASWNASFRQGGEFDADKLPAMTVEQWAAIANELPEGVVEYLAAKAEERAKMNRRPQLSLARRAARENLEILKEQGLIRLQENGKLIKPLPPEAYLEAWTQIRGSGKRPFLWVYEDSC